MLSTPDLQLTLSKNGGNILDTISDDQLQQHLDIRAKLKETDVSQDKAFQDAYKELHHFKRYRIKTQLQKRFFEVLEANKGAEELDPRQLAQELFGLLPRTQFNAKHFSMITRMMHTINPTYPIFEPEVVDLLQSETPKRINDNFFRSLNYYTDFYLHLQAMYDDLLEQNKLQNLIKAFTIKFKQFREMLTPGVCMDLLVRGASQLKKKDKLVTMRQAQVAV